MKLALDPLRRLGGQYIGFEMRGMHPTLADWVAFLPGSIAPLLLAFRDQVLPGSQLVIFADAMPEDNEACRAFCAEHELPFFESAEACERFFAGK